MLPPSGYILCGTPRTGSTLLCSLLSSTGVLGRPQSYFREPDEATWAGRLNVPVEGERARDYRDFARSVRAAATTGNGVFAARVMWGSLGRMIEGLGRTAGQSDVDVLEDAFGPLGFVFLRREDVVGQAVSWCRAEQTGFWQHGDTALCTPKQDVDQMKSLLDTIHEHNAAWQSWFDSQGVTPHHVTYEELVRDAHKTVGGIAAQLHVAVPTTWQPVSPHRKQADDTNDKWVAALRAALTRA